MMEFLNSNSFWALAGLIVFCIILVYYKVPSMLTKNLDERAKRINDELDQARLLREEAQQLLAEYQRKRAEAEKEAESIIAVAKREAEEMAKDALRKTEEYVERRNKLAEQKIAQAELDAIRAVRSTAIDIAVAAAGNVIENEIDKKKSDNLFQDSVKAIKAQLN